MLDEAKIVAEKHNYTLVDMRFIKPLDEALLQKVADSHELLVTLEENAIQGGAGSFVNEYLQNIGKIKPLVMLGIPDFFVPQSTQAEAYAILD
ncbi:1-deoxy-D-xylulose-5-phosphate synthase [Mannheimia haemolytica]|uniref:1-deoxy-D-xylulose-5-phosphate synthase n=1 Tax=Mannheimia haemolytica TaxID=75985 RepID=A0A378N8Q2_MANHA|nr:1-deoxy-D-xylulose-5-phosphate synthase [Mannheimia haemolytica]